MFKHTQHKTQEQGFALLLAVVISSIVLALGLSILQIIIKQVELGSSTKGSEVAYQAAAAGAECVQYLRHTYSTQFLQGSTVPADCFNWPNTSPTNLQLTNESSSNGAPLYHYYLSSGKDWQSDASTKECIGMDIYVLNNSAYTGAESNNALLPGDSCAAGDVCTFAYARGHNVSCAQTNTAGPLNNFQRELSITF